MALIHGKNARLFVDQYELTGNFTEFSMAAKAGTAEATVFGKGAKTFIGGLKEGTLTGKGFFDSAAAAEDQELAAALGRAVNMVVTFSPTGSMVPGTRLVASNAAETDYAISNPVNNVVGVTFSAQADSGLSTGFSFNDPGTNILKSATAITANTAATGPVAAGALPVTSTAGFQPAGGLIVATSTTPAYLTYTSIVDGTHFGGITVVIAGGAITTGVAYQGYQDYSLSSNDGLVACLHVITLTGSSPSFTAKFQHSSDGSTWVDLVSFNSGSAITAAGAYGAFVAANVTINKYLRAFVDSSASTSLTTFNAVISAARQ